MNVGEKNWEHLRWMYLFCAFPTQWKLRSSGFDKNLRTVLLSKEVAHHFHQLCQFLTRTTFHHYLIPAMLDFQQCAGVPPIQYAMYAKDHGFYGLFMGLIALPETKIFAPENGWLEDDPFLLG